MMRVVLTGATGFIGSYVLDELLKSNYSVLIILRKSSNTWRIHHHFKRCDVLELESNDFDSLPLKNTLQNYKPQALIHLAWDGVINEKRNHHSQWEENIKQSQLIGQTAIEAGISILIGIGSQAEYGPSNNSINENTLPKPTTLYGVAKLTVFHLFNSLCQLHNIRFVWCRIFSCYGPKDDPRWFIPGLILKLLRNETPSLTEGTQVWNYTYVTDVAKAIITSLTHSNAHGIFNLASPESVSVRSIAIKIRDMINPMLELGFGQIPFRSDQVMRMEANTEKLQSIMGWVPEITLEKGLFNTINWYRNNTLP